MSGLCHKDRVQRGQGRRLALLVTICALTMVLASPGVGAETPYPFEGSWVRADRVCSANAPHVRVYSHREVNSSNDHCQFRRVEFEYGEWQIDEECRRPERRRLTERLRMLGPDMMLVRRQVLRLKIPHGRRLVRCTIAGSGPASGGFKGSGNGAPLPKQAPAPAR